MINSDKIQDKENENINFVGLSAMNTNRKVKEEEGIFHQTISALKTFFIAGQLAKNGEISEDNEISTEQAIKSWFSRFSKSSKELSAANSLLQNLCSFITLQYTTRYLTIIL
ncbi:hypothetical protein F8M41_023999 [Gigaspora margarita]|uniref:Uncharacterized protein n=1 Tax=Gigaspora margarita TaxID=4874 RepID=A0A8H4ET70_GIGMA|nr:hypothetical protein F8M41_023999 [Gigaspora margarita]